MIPTGNDASKEERGTKSYLSTPENLDLQNKDNKYFSFFTAPITNKYPSNILDIKGLYELIKGESYAPQTKLLRSSTTPEVAKKIKSSVFDYVTFSGKFSERHSTKLITRSSYICCDLDHIGDLNDILELQIRIIDKLKPSLMFISPSGDGLKVIYRIEVGAGTHTEFFKALQVYFKEIIGFEIDPSGSDLCRACFLPQDKDAYYNEDCDTLDKSFIDTFLPKDEISIPQKDYSENRNMITCDDDIFQRLLTWLKKREVFAKGNRNSFLTKLANACNRFGIPEQEVQKKLYDFAEPGMLEDEIKAIIKSVYKHTERHGISLFDEKKPFDFTFQEETAIPGQEVKKQPVTTPLFPIEGLPNGKNAHFDQPSPEKPDQLNLLIVNKP
ncbi:MAG: primase C-terminal domain-containing protein [Bacteroidales bacterium]|nr:primase C-terminal domain-containing protein [Bacteroidales bacterium]